MALDTERQATSITVKTVPLLYVLLPMATGFALAGTWAVEPLWCLSVGGASLIAALALAWKETCGKWTFTLWLLLNSLGVFLTACAYAEMRKPQVPADFESLSGTVLIKVEEVFKSLYKGRVLQGLGKLVEVPEGADKLKHQRVYFRIYEEKAELKDPIGLYLRIQSRLVPILDNGGDFEIFLQRQLCRLKLYGTLEKVEEPASGFEKSLATNRQGMVEILHRGAESDGQKESANVATAMLLGSRGALSKEQNDSFRKSGAAHLFAVSGLHVGIIAFLLASCLNLVGLRGRTGALVGLALLLYYVFLIGAPPSAVRAWLMALCLWGAFVLKRQALPLSSLATSAFIALLIQPFQLFSTGFQLSYAVVAGILLMGVPLGQKWGRYNFYALIPPDALKWHQRTLLKLYRFLVLLLSVSLAASLFSAPLVIAYFEGATPLGFVVNLILVQLATLVLSVEFFGVALGLLGMDVFSAYANFLAWLPIELMELIAKQVSSLKIAYLNLSWPSPLVGLWTVLLMLGTAYTLPNHRQVYMWVPTGIFFLSVLLFATKV